MSWLPESATFHERVQECFAAFRGSGLMLNALDVELTNEWAASGAPFEIVAAGIRKAAERKLFDARPGEPALRSLRACRRDVDAEIARWQARSAGKSRPALSSKKRVRVAFEQLEAHRPELTTAIREALADLSGAREGDTAVEERALLRLMRSLPFSERVHVMRDACARTDALSGLSPWARRGIRRFHICAAIRKALSLPSFW